MLNKYQEVRRCEGMNYIGYWDICPDDFDKVIEKFQQAMADRAKGGEKYPKVIFPPQSLGGEWKGFTIYGDATPDQLTNLVLLYKGVMNFRIVPIFESAKFIEKYLKSK